MNPEIFKAYDIRGVYPDDLCEEDAWKIGHATARFLPSLIKGYERGLREAQSLVISRDMRTHSEPLAQALIEGIRSAGVGVIDIGMIDTPQIYFAVNYLGTCGGIQVTASHNPAKYNGFKISGRGAIPIGVDTGLKEIKHMATALPHTKGNPTGRLEQRDLWPEYRKHVLQFLRPNLKRKKIAIDASNGMAGKAIPILLADLPIDVVQINFEHAGKFKHDPDPLKEKNLTHLKATVKKEECDFGICFDGDADRMMMVDENGETIPCDLLTALLVPYFLEKKPKSAIVYDLRSSRVVMEEIIRYGGTPRRERVGHSYMKKALRDTHAVFGGELSGHFYFEQNFYADSAAIMLMHTLNVVDEKNKPMSELIRPLKRYYCSGENNFRVDHKELRMEELARRYSEGKIDHLDGVTVDFKDWWFNCRPSNTEPLLRLNVEAKTRDLLQEKFGEIEQQLGAPA
ncbi:MAG TPA: phosphomannomutase/phosphoglucomutase [Sedimentisphaerales bacterium]|jgi:phosphomannomutase|nr:phosphomannomutase/phosphoglucomutase [Sedimentisphaerales bacterium]HNU28147.1 phosphomannomutase/phosphoglucomutase [Sedimentisphaerales bacterium]